MDDSSRVQAFGTRVGFAEFEKPEGEPVIEEVHSASCGLPLAVLDTAPTCSEAKEGYLVQEVSDEHKPTEAEVEAAATAGASRRAWLLSLAPGSMLDVRNKDGVWFEASACPSTLTL